MNFDNLKIESTLKSQITPKSPKGDFRKILILSFFPLGAGEEKSLKSEFLTFRSELKIV